MQEHNFDEILDYLCSGIMSKTERQSVRDELYDHLMCRFETNLAVGMDETEAEKNAVDALGDKSALKFRLSQVHSYAPKPTLKKAINLLVFGIIVNVFFGLLGFKSAYFSDELLCGIMECIMLVGSVAVIVALFCLRTANKKLRNAFYFTIAEFVLNIISTALLPVWTNGFEIRVPFEIACNILKIIILFYLMYGLNELAKPYGYDKAAQLDNSLVLCLFVPVILLVLNIIYFIDGDLYYEKISNVRLGGMAGLALGAMSICLREISKTLWNSDHEYRIENSPKKKAVVAILAIIIAVVPSIVVDISLATQKAETSVYTVEDSAVPQNEYERICSNLLSYDIPEKIVYSLPKSEIKNYSDSVNKSDYSEENLKYLEETVCTYNTTICNDVEAAFSSCAIGMTDSTGYPYVRVLSWVEYLSEGKGYDDALFWIPRKNNWFVQNLSEEYEGDFLLILSEENDKIIKNEPLDIYTDKDGLTDRMTGVRFQSKENLTVIHAETFGLSRQSGATFANYYFEVCHRTSPLAFGYRSPLTAKENRVRQNWLGYCWRTVESEIVWGILFEDTTESVINA